MVANIPQTVQSDGIPLGLQKRMNVWKGSFHAHTGVSLQLFGTIERSRIPAVRRGVSQTASALWNFMFSSRLRTGTLP